MYITQKIRKTSYSKYLANEYTLFELLLNTGIYI